MTTTTPTTQTAGQTLTLSYVDLRQTDGRPWATFDTLDQARDYLADAATRYVDLELAEPVEVTRTYAVGDAVEVNAFARWRSGVVVKLGRSRVSVRYVRNAEGLQVDRTFTGYDVRPAAAL